MHKPKLLLLLHNLLLFVLLAPNVVTSLSEHRFTSDWDPFCDDEMFHKPYIRIRDGRTGKMINDAGPGLIDLQKKENLYICANGIVFLYFKLTMYEGESVYDEGAMQYASHYCGFYNGKPGIGPWNPKTNTAKLVAILRLGDRHDYRKISLQMFIAPSWDVTKNAFSTYTSLVVINSNGECILRKGDERARIRIRANPLTDATAATDVNEKPTTICRLDIKKLLKENTTDTPFKTSIATIDADTDLKSETLQALDVTNGTDLKLDGCWLYPLLDSSQMDIIHRKMTQTSEASFLLDDKVVSELNPSSKDGAKSGFWTPERLTEYNIGNGPKEEIKTDANAVKTECDKYEAEKSKDKVDEKEVDKTKKACQLSQLHLKLAPETAKYIKLFAKAKTYGDDTKAAWIATWDEVKKDDVNFTRVNYTQVQVDLQRYYHGLRLNPYDPSLVAKIEEGEKAKKDIYEKLLAEKTAKDVGPKITKAEVMQARYASVKKTLIELNKKMQNIILEYELHQKHGVKTEAHLDLHDVKLKHLDLFLSLETPSGAAASTGNMEDDSICINFEQRTEQCKNIKPDAKRVCDIAKGWLGPKEGDAKQYEELFKLVDKIFNQGCPYLDEKFPSLVHGIIKGYLNKKPDGIGIEPKTSIKGSPYINATVQHFEKKDNLYTEGASAVLADVVNELKNCEGKFKSIEFVPGEGKPLSLKFKDETVPNIVEQAENEFSFNWVIDTSYRIFSTVLGLCYEAKDEEKAKSFYDKFHEILKLSNLIWLSNRDNNIFKVILGKYYVTGKGDFWTKNCMEASFIEGDKATLRPTRKLLVNDYTEPNFFVNNIRSNLFNPEVKE